ncbi:hypothetical protein ROZALSC1DRAFT_24959, partial [Rozella allomycis CSF55]
CFASHNLLAISCSIFFFFTGRISSFDETFKLNNDWIQQVMEMYNQVVEEYSKISLLGVQIQMLSQRELVNNMYKNLSKLWKKDASESSGDWLNVVPVSGLGLTRLGLNSLIIMAHVLNVQKVNQTVMVITLQENMIWLTIFLVASQTIGSPYVEHVFNKTLEEGAALMKSRDQNIKKYLDKCETKDLIFFPFHWRNGRRFFVFPFNDSEKTGINI